MKSNLANLSYHRRTLSPEEFEKKWRSAIYGYAIGIDRSLPETNVF